MNNKIYIAMSGGVDSSVAAHLLKQQGFCVEGITMLLCRGEDDSRADAVRNAADRLDIPFRTVDFRDDFENCVVDDFVRAYEAGLTPNPCAVCNRTIKFGRLMEAAGDGLLATGHYAKLRRNAESGRVQLMKAADRSKDQSYFLYGLSQETLSRVVFPLGNMTKAEIRNIAGELDLAAAHSKESQDICFIPDGDYASFIREYTGADYPAGDFIDEAGNVLGTHKGIIGYTVGQRKGLGVSFGRPLYVKRLDTDGNRVILADNEALLSRELTAYDFNWVSIPPQTDSFRASARIRYRHREAPCTVEPRSDRSVRIVFDEPQRAITPGQSAVIYDGDLVLGGGTISTQQ